MSTASGWADVEMAFVLQNQASSQGINVKWWWRPLLTTGFYLFAYRALHGPKVLLDSTQANQAGDIGWMVEIDMWMMRDRTIDTYLGSEREELKYTCVNFMA